MLVDRGCNYNTCCRDFALCHFGFLYLSTLFCHHSLYCLLGCLLCFLCLSTLFLCHSYSSLLYFLGLSLFLLCDNTGKLCCSLGYSFCFLLLSTLQSPLFVLLLFLCDSPSFTGVHDPSILNLLTICLLVGSSSSFCCMYMCKFVLGDC